MKFLNAKLMACFIILAINVLKAQTTKFDETGKLTALITNGNALSNFNTSDLKSEDKKLKEEARKLLAKKINETIKILSDPNYKKSIYRFYNNLWNGAGEKTNLIGYLNQLLERLAEKTLSKPEFSQYSDWKTPFDNNLLSTSANIYETEFDASKPNRMTLLKKNPFNNFLLDYYNTALPKLNAPNIYVDIESIAFHSSFLINEQQALKRFLQSTREDVITVEVYKKMKDYHDKLTANPSTFDTVKTMFSQDWFKEWFWFRGGEIRLNPFDFTTEAFLKKNPQFNAAKVTKFNEFIDTVINRQIRYDSIGRIEEFKTKLLIQGTGQSIFSLQQRHDSINKLNEDQRKEFLSITQLLNKVEIPEAGPFFNYSAITDIKFKNNEDALKAPLHVDEVKTIVIHNIISTAKTGLQESSKPIPDRSGFQDGFDTVVSQLGSLALIMAKFSPYANYFDFLNPLPKIPANAILPNTVSIPAAFAPPIPNRTLDLELIQLKFNNTLSGAERIQENLSVVLIKYGMYESSIFRKVFLDGTVTNESLNKVYSDLSLKTIYINKLKKYWEKLCIAQVNLLQQDSILIDGFLNIYNNSSFPETELLEAIKPKQALYTSKILKTTPSKTAIENSVSIYSHINKDTSTIDKLSYKVGKNYRLALGAGIAYTLNNYDQSVITETNGQIKITNNVRLYRFVVGLHVYLGKGLFPQDNSFAGSYSERFSIFAGVGFPGPLENLYFGISRDLVPGLKLTAGIHIAKNNRYVIQNNHIVEESLRYQVAGPFVSVAFDPTSFINLLNVFKKQ
jgi:hypothetical protein